MLDLIEQALPWRFVFSPPNDFRPVAKSRARKVIVGYFDHDFWIDRLPFAASLRAPPAGAAGSVAGKTGRLPKRFEFFR